MRLFKSLLSKVNAGVVVNALALMMVVHNVNVACTWLAYQPEVPECAKKLIKES